MHPEGPLVVPGKYKAVLKTNNKEYSKEFAVKPDPRVKATMQDFNEQLKFALELDSVLTKTTELYHKVDDLIKNKKSNLSKSEIDSLKEIRKKLSDIDGTFAGLTTDVQTADTAPSQGVRDVYGAYLKMLEEVVGEMK
jgi:hypothetical protein